MLTFQPSIFVARGPFDLSISPPTRQTNASPRRICPRIISMCKPSQPPPLSASASEFPPQPKWKVPRTTIHPEIFIVDGLSLLEHIMRTLGTPASSQSLSENPRPVHAFSFILTTLLTAHVANTSAFTVVFPATSAGTILSPIARLAATAARLCTSVGLHVTFAKGRIGDVIATLTRLSDRSGVSPVLVTASSPTPLYQLLQWPSARLLVMQRSGVFDLVAADQLNHALGLSQQLSVSPRHVPDILALAYSIAPADSRARKDPKSLVHTAAVLLTHFQSVYRVIRAARILLSTNPTPSACPALTKRLARRIVANEANIGQRQRFLYLSDDAPLAHITWQALQRAPIDIEDLARLSSAFQFARNNLLNRLLFAVKSEETVSTESSDLNHCKAPTGRAESIDSGQASTASASYNVSSDRSYVVKQTFFYSDLPISDNNGIMGLFPLFQTTGSDPPHLKALSITARPGTALLIPLENESRLPEDLTRILIDDNIAKHGWFLKDIYKALLKQFNIRLAGVLFDNHLAAHLLSAGENMTDAQIISKYLSDDEMSQAVLHHSEDPPISSTSHPDRAFVLCDAGFRLSQRLKTAISDAGLSAIMDDIEGPLIPVLGDMELAGVPIDFHLLQKVHDRLRQHRIRLRRKLKTILRRNSDNGEKSSLQLSSTKDIQFFLSPVLRVGADEKELRRTEEEFVINSKTLSKIASNYALPLKYRQFASLFLRFREATKLVRVHTKGLLETLRLDGRVHPNFSQAASSSGRISTTRPNLQALPLRTSVFCPSLRQLIRAGPGRCVVCADYCHIELRIAAAMSGDSNLMLSIEGDKDVHKDIATRMYGVSDINDVTTLQRAVAKKVAYSILYGVSARGLSDRLGMALRDAELLIIQFFECYPTLKRFTEQMVHDAVSSGYARTLIGRRQRLTNLVNGTEKERRSARRVAINMPIQGTQADMLKLAMVCISRRLREMNSKSMLIMQLHDELVLDVDNDERDSVMRLVTEEMQRALPLPRVDIVIKIGQGSTWLRASENATICRREVERAI